VPELADPLIKIVTGVKVRKPEPCVSVRKADSAIAASSQREAELHTACLSNKRTTPSGDGAAGRFTKIRDTQPDGGGVRCVVQSVSGGIGSAHGTYRVCSWNPPTESH
jgi:hypothetical protein